MLIYCTHFLRQNPLPYGYHWLTIFLFLISSSHLTSILTYLQCYTTNSPSSFFSLDSTSLPSIHTYDASYTIQQRNHLIINHYWSIKPTFFKCHFSSAVVIIIFISLDANQLLFHLVVTNNTTDYQNIAHELQIDYSLSFCLVHPFN